MSPGLHHLPLAQGSSGAVTCSMYGLYKLKVIK
jgi:hypothetical protein